MSKSADSYAGDKAWADFVNAIRPFWAPCTNKTELVQLFGGAEDLAIGAYYLAGKHAEEWAKSPVPALGGRKPLSLLASESGLKELKSAMMSAP
ncbi:MAG: antitoxin Xre/MbcA/ParS toxin-binding domain-containing protein [Verrucomicrobiota bacterium]